MSELTWRKARRSISNGACAEVATRPGLVLVRDSRQPGWPVLAFPAAAWRAFTAAGKDGKA